MTEPASEPEDAEGHCSLQPNCWVFSQLKKGSKNLKIVKPCCLINKYKGFSKKCFYLQQQITETATFSIEIETATAGFYSTCLKKIDTRGQKGSQFLKPTQIISLMLRLLFSPGSLNYFFPDNVHG